MLSFIVRQITSNTSWFDNYLLYSGSETPFYHILLTLGMCRGACVVSSLLSLLVRYPSTILVDSLQWTQSSYTLLFLISSHPTN